MDEILIQQLHEEDHKWTNFDLEEEEVKNRIIDEIAVALVAESMADMKKTYSSIHNDEST